MIWSSANLKFAQRHFILKIDLLSDGLHLLLLVTSIWSVQLDATAVKKYSRRISTEQRSLLEILILEALPRVTARTWSCQDQWCWIYVEHKGKQILNTVALLKLTERDRKTVVGNHRKAKRDLGWSNHLFVRWTMNKIVFVSKHTEFAAHLITLPVCYNIWPILSNAVKAFTVL